MKTEKHRLWTSTVRFALAGESFDIISYSLLSMYNIAEMYLEKD